MNALRIKYTPIGELKPMPGNPRRNEEAIGPVAESIKRFGWTNPILARKEDGVVVAGHTRLEAAKLLGIDKVPTVFVDLDSVSSRLYNLADNKLNEVAEWDDQALAVMLRELAEEDAAGLAIAGFGEAEVDKLLADVAGPKTGLTDPDEVPDEPSEVWVKTGDLFELGAHRLLCGDSTKAADVDRLMGEERAAICWTDPPWNVGIGTHSAYGDKKKNRAISNDNLGEDFPAFCESLAAQAFRVMLPGAHLYLAMSTQEWPVIDAVLRAVGFHWSTTIIWAKDRLILSQRDYHTQYEPIWYGWRGDAPRIHPLEDRKQSDVWQIPRPGRSDEHPTMKPVELVVRSLQNSSAPRTIVYEPFCGSGTTLIACEQVGRRCRAIELEPRYVQVAIERWESFIGEKAKKVS